MIEWCFWKYVSIVAKGLFLCTAKQYISSRSWKKHDHTKLRAVLPHRRLYLKEWYYLHHLTGPTPAGSYRHPDKSSSVVCWGTCPQGQAWVWAYDTLAVMLILNLNMNACMLPGHLVQFAKSQKNAAEVADDLHIMKAMI